MEKDWHFLNSNNPVSLASVFSSMQSNISWEGELAPQAAYKEGTDGVWTPKTAGRDGECSKGTESLILKQTRAIRHCLTTSVHEIERSIIHIF